ncbi:DUF6531 domain-containing protein [Pseudomonas lini]
MKIRKKCTPILLCALLTTQNSLGEDYYWQFQPESGIPEKFSSPESGCRWLHKESEDSWNYTPPIEREDKLAWDCHMIFGDDPVDDSYGALAIMLYGEHCTKGNKFNSISGQCEFLKASYACPSSITGNPIDFSTGYKLQSETDYSFSSNNNRENAIEFTRYYRSADGLWVHNYSDRLNIENNSVTVIHNNGNQYVFKKVGHLYVGEATEASTLNQHDNRWIYQSTNGMTLVFDNSGKLVSTRRHSLSTTISYSGTVATVTDSFGNSLQFTEDSRKQPLSLKVGQTQIRYQYNKYKQLISVIKNHPEFQETRRYFYEDQRDSRLLTAIEDQRGIKYAAWTYDQYGRAISSEHALGTEKVTVQYNPDDSTTVSNALGKNTTYKFGYFQSAKRITSIIGEPTANCPQSNSTFTYDERGFLTSQTDGKGITTLFTHNDRGLVTSRIDASGTPESRTITTEWHATLPLPLRIQQPNRSILYTYDAEGRKLSQTIETH